MTFYVQNDTVLLADVFSNFRNMYFEIYGLDPAYSFFCIKISMANSLKKDQSKNRSIDWYWSVINDRKRYQTLEYTMLFIHMRKLMANT